MAAAGWRVVAWDQRGHGDSDHAPLYGWDADIRDAMAVMDAVTQRPAPVIGHSKGGSLMIQLADAQPYRFSHLVNLDGLPSKRRIPDVAEHERTRMVAGEISGWLDHRRRSADLARRPGTIEELARRRGRMNPRLSFEWLCHLVTVGARHDAGRLAVEDRRVDALRRLRPVAAGVDGDPPARPGMPFLGVLASELEEMGWGTLPHHVSHIPARRWAVSKCSTGRPLRAHRAARPGRRDGPRLPGFGMTDHDAAAQQDRPGACTTCATAETDTALLLLHGLGESSPVGAARTWAAHWPGPVAALDFTGHGHSTVPAGGGYTAEILLADADVALAELGAATLVGRGLGAYVALMLAGARPQQVRGAVLCDGPGSGRRRHRADVAELRHAGRRARTRPTRTRCSSCRATCARPTTRRCSCAWRSNHRASTSRSPSLPWCARRGWPRWSTRSG